MSHKKSVLSFSSMRLNARFGILLGGMAVVSLVLFVVYSVYAQRSAEDQFVGQGRVLTNALALQVNFDMIMGDDEGMIERLDVLLEGGAVKGGIFRDSKGSEVTAKGLEGELRRAKAPVDDVVWETDANDNRVLVATTSVINQANGESLGTVTLVLPADRLDQQRRASIGVALAISALLVLMGLAILVIVRRTVVRPVDELRLAAGRVASGDLTAQVDVVGRDEVAELARSFNEMVAASRQSHEELATETARAADAREHAEDLQRQSEEEGRYLKEQFDRIAEVIAAVMHGDLTRRLEVHREDNVGMLMNQINAMVEDLSALIAQVHRAGTRLSEASGRVASSAEEMSLGAQDQARQTAEVAAAVEEMSSTISESSRNAHHANETARRASDVAREGEGSFRETTQGMERIAEIVKESVDKVTALGDSSAQIGEIIRVIGDIADQTNLLALNAAIEAARAGDQGRGFAVVADEVRKLAERTTSATKEIADMITRIQHNTNDVVDSMRRGDTEVEKGLRIAAEAGTSLADIVTSITEMVSMIDQIAAGSEQQSITSTQIAQNVESISNVSDEVSQSTTELARTADVMSQQAHEMGRLIERFRISDVDHDDETPDVYMTRMN